MSVSPLHIDVLWTASNTTMHDKFRLAGGNSAWNRTEMWQWHLSAGWWWWWGWGCMPDNREFLMSLKWVTDHRKHWGCSHINGTVHHICIQQRCFKTSHFITKVHFCVCGLCTMEQGGGNQYTFHQWLQKERAVVAAYPHISPEVNDSAHLGATSTWWNTVSPTEIPE